MPKFGVKLTPLVARVGSQALLLAYFGMDSTHAPSPQAHQRSFSQNPPEHFYHVAY